MELSERLSGDPEVASDPLNTLLTERIGYGAAQQKLTRSLYLLLFSEGCESIALGLLLPILRLQWELSTFEQSMLITVVYLGVAVGSYMVVYSDRYGRYAFIMWDVVLQLVFGLLSCVCWNYSSFLVTRFFYGVGIGICLPLSASYITEISPAYMRASLLSKSRVYWSAGSVVTCLLGWVFLRDNSWRTMLLLICLPGAYALYEHWSFGRESLRYLWVQGRQNEVVDMVGWMCELNGSEKVQASQVVSLMERERRGRQPEQQLPMSAMLQQKYVGSTVRLVGCWFSVCFIYYGIMLLLPSILGKVLGEGKNGKYIFLVGISIVEVVSFYVSTSIMDHPRIGRKKGVYWGFSIIFFMSFVIMVVGEHRPFLLFVALSIVKFLISATFMILYPYTAQIYETMIRGTALGVLSSVGRAATTLIGVVGVYAMQWFGGNGLYVLFALLSIAAGYGAFTMPFCTGNRPIH